MALVARILSLTLLLAGCVILLADFSSKDPQEKLRTVIHTQAQSRSIPPWEAEAMYWLPLVLGVVGTYATRSVKPPRSNLPKRAIH